MKHLICSCLLVVMLMNVSYDSLAQQVPSDITIDVKDSSSIKNASRIKKILFEAHMYFSLSEVVHFSPPFVTPYLLKYVDPQTSPNGKTEQLGATYCTPKIIEVAITGDLNTDLKTLAHEHIHIIQGIISNCKRFSSYSPEQMLPYEDRNFEKEAFKLATKMIAKYLRWRMTGKIEALDDIVKEIDQGL